ncbi:MAG: outer membrane protein assembly factor BamC [Gammaproteobacteria bacterium]|nr:outer membrane protein assembly factor BamC [Gammaproteobacteria bacterium]
MLNFKLAGIALSITLLSGCSFLGLGKDKEKIQLEEIVSLEIPPNLSTPMDSGLLAIPEPDISNSSQVVEKRILQRPEHVEIIRDGTSYWIKVVSDRDNLWDSLLQFWKETQIKLRVKNRAHGIIETSWFSGDDQRFASDTKNKFRLRIEEAEGDLQTLELYITHYGVVGTDIGAEKLQWTNRERDRDIEVEFVHQLADYLDRAQAKVSTADKRSSDYSISDEKLVITEDFKRAWRKVGIALDKGNIIVNDRDRNKGIYFVTEVDFLEDLGGERGLLDRYVFGDKVKQGKPFEVHIKSRDEQSVISVIGETMTPAKKVFVLKAIRDNL